MTGLPYSQYVRPSSHVMRVGRLSAGTVTPLHDIVAPTLSDLPGDIAAQLRREFWKRHGDAPAWEQKHDAQAWLAGEVAEFEREKIHRAFDEEEIRALAKRWSDLCGKMQSLEVMQDFARSVGIEPPEVKEHGSNQKSRVGCARRLQCARWWRRQIRKCYLRRAEAHLRARGFVHRRRQVYASDRAVENRRQRGASNKALLQELCAVSDAGDQLELWTVVEKSNANPAIRRAELMARLRGFEEIAQSAGHVALFFTLTCPSAFHRMHSNGTHNERWEGAPPRVGQQWLSKMWARARAKLARLSIVYYGFRVAEPHHDGTPHWHAVLFVAAHHADALRTVIEGVWLSEYSHEPGAKKIRSKSIKIDPAKGSACGYVAKYVAKNIDGYEVGDDFETEGAQASESCDRVAAWASAHGIRQFQQIGGPAVSVWRELRRLRSSIDVDGADEIEAARKAADAGEWSAVVELLGGVAAGRRGRVALWTERTGELNQFEELKAPAIAGVQAFTSEGAVSVLKPKCDASSKREVQGTEETGADRPAASIRRSLSGDGAPSPLGLVRVRTRTKCWRIERKAGSGITGRSGCERGLANSSLRDSPPSLGPVSITVRGSTNVPAGTIAGNESKLNVRGPPWMH